MRQKLEAAGFREFTHYDERRQPVYEPDPVSGRTFDETTWISRILEESAEVVEQLQLTLVQLFGAKEFSKFCKRDRLRLY